MTYQERQEIYLSKLDELEAELSLCRRADTARALRAEIEEEETAWAEFQAERKIL